MSRPSLTKEEKELHDKILKTMEENPVLKFNVVMKIAGCNNNNPASSKIIPQKYLKKIDNFLTYHKFKK